MYITIIFFDIYSKAYKFEIHNIIMYLTFLLVFCDLFAYLEKVSW